MASKRKKGPYPIPREPKITQQLRLPVTLHRALKAAARTERTSMHAEMLRRLAIDPDREWMANMLRLILEAVNGRKAQEGQAAQNGSALQERKPEAEQP